MDDNVLYTKNQIIKNIGDIIISIGSINKYFTILYANLLKKLSEYYNYVIYSCNLGLTNYMESFKEIKYVCPDENYDEFCNLNKKNENRITMSKFYSKLTNYNIIHRKNMLSFIITLFKNITSHLNIENKNKEIDEIVENIFVLCTELDFKKTDNMKYIISINKYINDFSKLKPSEYKSFSNKSLFKFMDLLEELDLEDSDSDSESDSDSDSDSD